MRHQKTRHKLSRDASHRKALLRNLCREVIQHERIQTSQAKAKAVKPELEKLITLAKRGDLHARRIALSRVRDEAMAFTGRDARFEMSADADWDDPALDDTNSDWVRAALAIVEPDAVMGRYVNEIAESGPEESRAIYGDPKVARLATLKRAWDPDNVFRLNHNIAP